MTLLCLRRLEVPQGLDADSPHLADGAISTLLTSLASQVSPFQTSFKRCRLVSSSNHLTRQFQLSLRVHPTALLQIAKGYQHLGAGSVIPPAQWNADSLAAFAMSVGCSYASSSRPAIIMVDYLASELQAVRAALAAKRHSIASVAAEPVSLASELHLLSRLLSIPSFSEDALNHAPEKPLAAISAKLTSLLGKLPADALAQQAPLLDATDASPDVLSLLSAINDHLRSDYALRREMLLQRLDVTVQSFLWSVKAQGHEGDIMGAIRSRRAALSGNPAGIQPSDAFAAGPDLSRALTARMTDDNTRSMRAASVKGVLIGRVPDRGGRVTAADKPTARELGMPEWQARKDEKKAQQQQKAGGGGGGGKPHQADQKKPASPSHAAASSSSSSSAAAVGTGAEVAYDASHYERAKSLLREAAGQEGEAGAAVEELERGEDEEQHEGGTMMMQVEPEGAASSSERAPAAAASSSGGRGGGGGGGCFKCGQADHFARDCPNGGGGGGGGGRRGHHGRGGGGGRGRGGGGKRPLEKS